MAAEKGNMVRHWYRRKRYRIKTRRLVFAALFMAFLIAGIVSAVHIATDQIAYWQSRQEYDVLRQYAPTAMLPSTPAQQNASSAAPASTPASSLTPREQSVLNQPAETVKPAEEPTPKRLSEINPDYIGWMRIEGTNIDYPVVQGTDNQKYLSVSFSGDKNASGAIFMDSGCTNQLESPLAIIHGHNMNDGSMFSGLNLYLDPGYLAEHPQIVISTLDGITAAYRIIAVRVTDIHDAAYTLIHEDQKSVSAYLTSLGKAEDAKQILALSTCTNSGDDNERLLVFAAAE